MKVCTVGDILLFVSSGIIPVVSKVASDISDPSDLQQDADDKATPLIRPPPPFTAMNVQQETASHSNVSHDVHSQSQDVSVESHDQEEEVTVRSHDVDPEMARLGTQLDGWCLDLKRNVLVSVYCHT